MRKTLAVVALLTALSVSAGTITSLDPSTITANSGEYFMTIYGTGLGDQLLFDGPAGQFVLDINARGVDNVVGWVPMGIANRAGTYKVSVLGGNGGNAGPATFQVVDPFNVRQPFALVLPEAVVATAIGKTGVVRYEVGASGGDDPHPTVKCDPPSGSSFPVGTTLVKCQASNQFGENAQGSFPVFVHDASPPVLKLPNRITVPADAREGSFVKFEVSATDEVDGKVTPVCDEKSNALFPVGVTTVTCLATDLSFNSARGSFTIDVVDKDSLFQIHVPEPIFAAAESREGAKVQFEVYTTGTLDPNPRITCEPASGATFPIGTTLVKCSATDSFGKSDDDRFEVTVADTTAPLVNSIKASPNVFEASGDYVGVVVAVDATDTIDPNPRCSISYVVGSEPISTRDWSIGSALEVKLNAVTTGAENRIYRIVVSCTDESFNTSLDEALVTVISRGGNASAASTETGTRRRTVRP